MRYEGWTATSLLPATYLFARWRMATFGHGNRAALGFQHSAPAFLQLSPKLELLEGCMVSK